MSALAAQDEAAARRRARALDKARAAKARKAAQRLREERRTVKSFDGWVREESQAFAEMMRAAQSEGRNSPTFARLNRLWLEVWRATPKPLPDDKSQAWER